MARPNPVSIFLRLATLAALASAAFLLGKVLSSSTISSKTTPTLPAPTPSESTTPSASLPALSSSEAFPFLLEAIESGDEFRIHYTAAFLAKRLSPDQLSALLIQAAPLQQKHATIARTILSLELAHKSPNLFAATIQSDALASGNSFDAVTAFRYLAKSFPDFAVELTKKLPPNLEHLAWSGIHQSNNPRAQALFRGYQEAKYKESNEQSFREQRDALISSIRDGSYLADSINFRSQFISAFHSRREEGFELAQQIKDPAIRLALAGNLLEYPWPSSSIDRQLDLIANYQVDDTGFSSERRNHLFTRLFQNSTTDQRPAILDWLSSNLSRDQQNAFLTQGYSLISGNPQQFLYSSLLQNAPPSPLKQRLTRNALQQIASTDLDTALDYLTQNTDPNQAENLLASLVAPTFQTSGPEAAIAILDTLTTDQARNEALHALSSFWGNRDPLGFMEWALPLEGDQAYLSALSSVSYTWAQKNPDEAATFAESLPNGPTKRELQANVGRKLAQHSPFEAIEYAASLSDTQASYNILSSAAHAWALIDPEAAASFFVDTIEAPDLTQPNTPTEAIQLFNQASLIFQNTAEAWASHAPEAATRFFAQTDNTLAAKSGLPSSFGRWFEFDETAAVDFIITLDFSSLNDESIQALAISHQLVRSYPELSYELVSHISDPTFASATKQSIQNIQNFINQYEPRP